MKLQDHGAAESLRNIVQAPQVPLFVEYLYQSSTAEIPDVALAVAAMASGDVVCQYGVIEVTELTGSALSKAQSVSAVPGAAS